MSFDKERGQGPILQETEPSEFTLDLRKLPGKYRKLRVYVTKDRDTGAQCEVIVNWAGQVVYKSQDIAMFDRIKEKIVLKEYRLTYADGRMNFALKTADPFPGPERRGRRDRRGDGDRRT